MILWLTTTTIRIRTPCSQPQDSEENQYTCEEAHYDLNLDDISDDEETQPGPGYKLPKALLKGEQNPYRYFFFFKSSVGIY